MTTATLTDDAVHDDFPIWRLVAFALLIGVFFITGHNIENAKMSLTRGVEEFNPETADAFELLAQYETGSAVKGVAYLALGVFSFLSIVALQHIRPLNVRGLFPLALLFFVGWAIMSVLWAEEFGVTLNKVIIFAMLSLGAASFAQGFTDRQLVWVVLLSTGFYLLLGFGAEAVYGSFRPWVPGYRFSGSIHPNGQGMNCALLFLSALFLGLQEPRFRRLLFAVALIAFAFLVLTKSRTALGVTLVSVAAYGFLLIPAGLKIGLVALAGMGATFLAIFSRELVPVLGQAILLGRTDAGASSANKLSGRTDLWTACFDYIADHPLLGYGYNAFWTVDRTDEVFRQIDWVSGSAHSIYVDVLLGLGVVGFLPFAVVYLTGLVRSGKFYLDTRAPVYGFFWAVMVFTLFHGLTESAFLYSSLYTFISMLILARLALRPAPEGEGDAVPVSDGDPA